MGELYFNREDRRKLKKRLSKSGMSVDDAIALMERRIQYAAAEALPEGTIVKLDVDEIKSRPDYNKMQESYKKFVEENADTIFEVKYDEKHKSGKLVNLHKIDENNSSDNAPFLWYCGDLIVQKSSNDETLISSPQNVPESVQDS